ncbi:MAG: FAD-dependent oxidoreductase [Myxococcales bacterium]|nr:FAD-dependent oxidoreductase [Myxococcales bacterium]
MTADAPTLVLGSGIAGLTAGLELARRGVSVEVLEAAPVVGGRTSSFVDERGRDVDTGLHVVADHYVNLLELLASVRASKRLIWVKKHTYLRDGRPPMEWYFSPWRPPLHLVRPVREMPLGSRERLASAFAALEIASRTQSDLDELDHLSYRAWHDRYRLGEGFVLELAEAASDAATFLTVDKASARAVLSWMKYLMRHQHAGDVGLFAGSLDECLTRPLVDAIKALGGVVRTGVAATGFRFEGHRIAGVEVAEAASGKVVNRADGVVPGLAPSRRVLPAERVVSALPVQALRAILTPAQATDAGLSDAMRLDTTPAMSAIIWFDRAIRPVPEGAPLCTGCAFRDFIDLSVLGRTGPDAPGSVYQFVITRADSRVHDTDEQIIADVHADLGRVWPGAADARPVDAALERIGAAMFAAVPDAHQLRPQVRSAVGGLYVAGDWVRHDANASMEGAALSGRLAASALLEDLGRPGVVICTPPDQTVVPALRQLRRRWSA